MWAGYAVSGLLFVLLVTDVFMLWMGGNVPVAVRRVTEQLSLGDPNTVYIDISNPGRDALKLVVIDEAPEQLQLRNLYFSFPLSPGAQHTISYSIRPTERGEYHFRRVVILATGWLGLATRRIFSASPQTCRVLPSIIQMKEFEIKITSRTATLQGIKKLRRLGQTSEFEQIRNYVPGDDVRTVNWRATGRRNDIMVNQYQDERAQNIISIIDKSRVMKSPFNQLSLLDHAINSSLVISNVSMIKGDRAGIITFGDKLGARVHPGRGAAHLRYISKTLYNQETEFLEANYELLYYGIRKYVKSRSMLLLFSNFESLYNLQRVLPMLRTINKSHLLVVVFFEDTELQNLGNEDAKTLLNVYQQTMVQRFVIEKELIVNELNKFGIQSVLTPPHHLSVNVINKYLELKSRGMI